MRRTGYVHDQRYLLHDTGPYHPETSDRLVAIHKGIEAAGLLDKLKIIPAERADDKWIEAVHSKAYIRRFEEVCLSGNLMLDNPDNVMCVDTFETAFLAAGGVLKAVKMVMEGEIDNAFCAVRPPGHHAERAEAMGFCYFNNVAVAARYLQAEYGLKRIAIVDFDVHHGNGTQHIFESENAVFYYSVHEHPSFAYPGTGREFDGGIGAGAGFTKNSPLLPGMGDEEYEQAVVEELWPVMSMFRPEFMILSTGFDAHVDDDMSDMKLTTEGYRKIAERIVDMARSYSKGRFVSVLEGGYCLERLPELAADHIRVLLGEE